MSSTTTSQTPVHSTRLPHERAPMRAWIEFDGCVCCGSRIEVVRSARFGHVPFCRSCLDRSLHPGMWDELGEAGD
jgi:hypothetical protein